MTIPLNRIHSFSDLCDSIARELAVYHDGIENTAEDFKEESIAIATCVKNHIGALLANKSPTTLHEELRKIFELPSEPVRQIQHSDQSVSEIWSRNIDWIPELRRPVRRGSLEGRFVSFGRECDQSMAKPEGPPKIIRKINGARNTSRPMS